MRLKHYVHKVSLDEIPRPRLWLYWNDNESFTVGVHLETPWSDPVWGVDVDVTNPPPRLERIVDWVIARREKRS